MATVEGDCLLDVEDDAFQNLERVELDAKSTKSEATWSVPLQANKLSNS